MKIKLLEQNCDLKNMCPEDVVQSLGYTELTLKQLLAALQEGSEKVKTEIPLCAKNPSFEMEKYHALGKQYAVIAYEIFRRLMLKGEEPRISTYLAANRHQSSGSFPDTILFWADPDAITGLYDALGKDGCYACS